MHDRRFRPLALAFAALFIFVAAPLAFSATVLQQIGEFAIPEANQGVGVDDRYFYAVDNRTIAIALFELTRRT